MIEVIEVVKLKLGSRFKLTRLGGERCSKFSGRTGIIVGFSSANSSVRVLFDGTKTPRALHPSYIEPVTSTTAEDLKEGGSMCKNLA
jgi:hypothetical protein